MTKTEIVKKIASEALDKFEAISNSAQAQLNDSSPHAGTIANMNTFTSGKSLKNLKNIGLDKRTSCLTLIREPAIARILIKDENEQQKTYYICRATPANKIEGLASYKAPIGRLASLGIGSTYTLPNGVEYEVIERAQFHPNKNTNGWDSKDTIIESEALPPLTVESLRAALQDVLGADEVEDILGQLLAEEDENLNIIEGKRRNVITKMGLRDQPILDQFQDEIFRLPLNQKLMILGSPGTGKTTTLIRRLGQKIDYDYLDENEKKLVNNSRSFNEEVHSDSWIMFTPTELLKQYLKEAFSREGVPASDLKIKTWKDYRRELARNVFGILKTASGSGIFVYKESVGNLKPRTESNLIEWYNDFQSYQKANFFSTLEKSAKKLRKDTDNNINAIGERTVKILSNHEKKELSTIFLALDREQDLLKRTVDGLKLFTDKKISEHLNLQLNTDSSFLDSFADFLTQISKEDLVESDIEDIEEEDEVNLEETRIGRRAAANAFMQAIRSQSKAKTAKRKISPKSRNGKIINWLGDRISSFSHFEHVGTKLILQTHIRKFINPVNKFINQIPSRYRKYRKSPDTLNRYYISDGLSSTDINSLELDVIILSILDSARSLLKQSDILRDLEKNIWSPLKTVASLYKNQVLVDEATDFSPIQLSCMGKLTHPSIESFFACGDFNQRLTKWGAQKIEDIKWVFPDINVEEIMVSYRQSRQLNELAKQIIYSVEGITQDVILPENVDNEGVQPTLLENCASPQQKTEWLASRIQEIEQSLKQQLPSTAVFVNSEQEVMEVAEALGAALEHQNMRVVACPNGQVMGQENDIRVFDIQHIKGLEFEAVFFISVDQLSSLHPELFYKYLYVGATRAATYLGITCERNLPIKIDSLREHFTDTWS